MKIIAYVRVSTDQQDLQRQQHSILQYANTRGWVVDRFVESRCSSTKSTTNRGVECLRRLVLRSETKILIFSELSRLGRSVGEIARLVDELVPHADLHFIQEGMVLTKETNDIASTVQITMFSLFAQVERMLISERTKQALAARKAKGMKLGRPRGSRLDADEAQIRSWLQLGVTQKAISEKVGCTPVTLSNWLKRKRKQWKNEAAA